MKYLQDDGLSAGIRQKLNENSEGALLLESFKRRCSFSDEHIDLVSRIAAVDRQTAALFLADLIIRDITHPMPGMHGTFCLQTATSA